MKSNIDHKTVAGFGEEWSRFDQSSLEQKELEDIFDAYFHIFPWSKVGPDSVGFDLGCGSGRWTKLVAPRVGRLHCIDASLQALKVAQTNLADFENCDFHHASIDAIPLEDSSQDFGYSLGVLHHIPDTREALASCVNKLKPGAPFLVYCYYRFDNRPFWFQLIWKASELIRGLLSRLPWSMRYFFSQLLAFLVYWPLSRLSNLLEKFGADVNNFPLSFYRDKSMYVLRTDALDRFGTRLEQRFTKAELEEMLKCAGLVDITFSDRAPFWCALGYKKN